MEYPTYFAGLQIQEDSKINSSLKYQHFRLHESAIYGGDHVGILKISIALRLPWWFYKMSLKMKELTIYEDKILENDLE